MHEGLEDGLWYACGADGPGIYSVYPWHSIDEHYTVSGIERLNKTESQPALNLE
jgi:hypothetical protein